MKRWIIKNTMDKHLNNEGLVEYLLLSRGIEGKEKIQSFMKPDINELHNPFLLKDMDRAIERIDAAIKSRQNITIYGDYDVDGITSTSILMRAFERLGVNANYYIPDRMNEGYGINKEALDYIKSLSTNLIITVDCGISSIDEVEYVKSLGMDIIITDHHECKEIIPDTIVINPKRKDCTYPFKGLAGCGVAFKLVQALWNHYGLEGFEEYLDIAAIGTVADIVELREENRIIVKNGLRAINMSDKCGIKAIKNVAGLEKDITSFNIAFQISPRINAAGRLSNAKIAVELFTTRDYDKALQIAKFLDQENKSRQRIEDEILEDALQKIQNEYDLRYDRVIVLSSPNWHIGVVGIVASKLLDRFNRPVILICEDGDLGRGSGRSIEGFNLFENLCQCSDLLVKFGGHELAAGLSIEIGKIKELRERLNSLAMSVDAECFLDSISIDARVSEEDLNIETAEVLRDFEPYGCGNPSPVLCMDRMSVLSKRGVGSKEQHLKLSLQGNSQRFDAIYFNGVRELKDRNWQYVDTAFNIDINEWNNKRDIQLIVKDIKPNVEWITNSILDNYYRQIKYMFNGDEGEFDFKNVNIIMKDMKFLKDFAYFKKGYILISSYSSIKETGFLMDMVNVGYNKNMGLESQIILCPDIESMDFGQNEVLIYDFLTGSYEYERLSKKASNRIYQFFNFDIFDKIDKLVEDISIDEKNLFKIYDSLMYNEIIGTVSEISLKFGINVYKAYRIINYLKEKRAIEVFVKKDILKIARRNGISLGVSAFNIDDISVKKLIDIKKLIKSSLGEE